MNKDPRGVVPSSKEQRDYEAIKQLRPQSGAHSRQWLFWGYILLAMLLLWRLYYIASGLIEVSQDETLFWLQSKHLALSYYSKPLMTACTQYLGTAIWGDNAFGVRFFSPVCSAIIGVFCLRFCACE